MHDIAKTVIMGLVEGITEFLPVSSTGHLLLTNNLIDFDSVAGEKFAEAFEIIIQLGAILSVVAVFPRRFARLLRLSDNQGLSGFRGLTLLAITSIPAGLVGFATEKYIGRYLMNLKTAPITVALAFAVGAIWMAAVELYRPRARVVGLDNMTWKEALSMGLFQCLSLWPGMSRSASTILGGMMSGVERKTATEYSFLAAVPIMLVATLYKFLQTYQFLHVGQMQILAIGFVVSFFTAWLAVKLFIQFIGQHTLLPFAWYRLLAAAAVLYWLADWTVIRQWF